MLIKSYFTYPLQTLLLFLFVNLTVAQDFNIWNLDINFEWWFAPGSNLVLLYRNQLFNRDTATELDYSERLDNLFDQSTQHQFSLRINYLIDFNRMRRKNNSSLYFYHKSQAQQQQVDKICSIMANFRLLIGIKSITLVISIVFLTFQHNRKVNKDQDFKSRLI